MDPSAYRGNAPTHSGRSETLRFTETQQLKATHAGLWHKTILSVTAAYRNLTSVPADEHATLFGMPLSLCLNQSTSDLLQWLQQYRSGQERLIQLLPFALFDRPPAPPVGVQISLQISLCLLPLWAPGSGATARVPLRANFNISVL